MDLKGRTVMVTGASSGIGRETAREFAKAGANVVLISRNLEKLNHLAQELAPLAGQTLVVAADIADRAAVGAVVERTVQTFGGVHILVNNAGQALNATLAEGDLDNMHYLFEVNLFGALYAIQAVVPYMRQQRRGVIVNVASVAGRIAAPYNGIYSATKAALIAISDALRLELGADGVRVITVYPGYTATALHEKAIQEIKQLAPSRALRGVPAQLAARKIVRAVRREQREAFITFGDILAVAIKNIAPRLVDWGVRRFWLASRHDQPSG